MANTVKYIGQPRWLGRRKWLVFIHILTWDEGNATQEESESDYPDRDQINGNDYSLYKYGFTAETKEGLLNLLIVMLLLRQGLSNCLLGINNPIYRGIILVLFLGIMKYLPVTLK